MSDNPAMPDDGTETHYLNGTYYKHDGCGWLFYNGINWLYSGLPKSELDRLERLKTI